MYDVVIIGAGISGTMIAKDLSKYKLKVALIEKENDIADGATMANSAIVHTGYDPEDGTLKAKLNVEGARMYPKLCEDLGCQLKQIGAYIVATSEEEENTLNVLASRAENRNVPYEWLTGDQARETEKNLSEQITKALSFPTTAVIYPWEVAHACGQVAVRNGVEVYLNTPCTSIEKNDGFYVLHTPNQSFETKVIVNASGCHADQIYAMVGTPNFTMKPRKGEYYVLDQDVHVVDHIIFPVPSSKGKGVLAVPTVYGNTLIGPNSLFSSEKDEKGTTSDGLKEVRENISKTLKNVPLNQSIRTFAGLRPSSTSSDFLIFEAEDAPGFINVASIESPGLASAPAISKYVLETLISKHFDLVEDENAVMTRKRPVVMAELSLEEKAEMIRNHPDYAKIICRCEQISEGEIVAAIHDTCGATTVKGIKKRVRPGMGRCQGGFCEPRVVSILARELNISPLDVCLDGKQSHILYKENR